MSETMSKLWTFIKLLIKRWVLLLIFYGSIIGAAIIFRLLRVTIPSWIFWILAFIGFVWASFQVYLEQLNKIPKKIPEEEKSYKPKPNISIVMLEGNEYNK